MAERMLPAVRREEDQGETSLRPQTLAEFIGQAKVCSNLKVFIEAARGAPRGARPCAVRRAPRPRQDHARPDRGARARRQFPRHLRPGHRQGRRPRRAAHQSRGPRRAVHRRDPPAQSGGRGDPLSGAWRTSSSTSSSARGRRRVRCASTLSRFTLIGATTRTGLLTTPLRERFGIPIRLEFYEVRGARGDRAARRAAARAAADAEGAHEIARRARGTPRVAGRLLRRVRDFASVEGAGAVDAKLADKRAVAARSRRTRARCARSPLSAADRGQLRRRPGRHRDASPPALSEPRDAIEEIIEPYLLQQGFIARTPRGRVLTAQGLRPSRPAAAGAKPLSFPSSTAPRIEAALLSLPFMGGGDSLLSAGWGERRFRKIPHPAGRPPRVGGTEEQAFRSLQRPASRRCSTCRDPRTPGTGTRNSREWTRPRHC